MDAPYTKRELDMFIDRFGDMFKDHAKKLDDFIEDRKQHDETIKALFVKVSNNSGSITQLWEAQAKLNAQGEANSKATKLIDEITTSWKWGKIVVVSTVSVLLFFASVYKIITGGIEDGLHAIKNLF